MSSINFSTGISSMPETKDPERYYELQKIHNAIGILTDKFSQLAVPDASQTTGLEQYTGRVFEAVVTTEIGFSLNIPMLGLPIHVGSSFLTADPGPYASAISTDRPANALIVGVTDFIPSANRGYITGGFFYPGYGIGSKVICMMRTPGLVITRRFLYPQITEVFTSSATWFLWRNKAYGSIEAFSPNRPSPDYDNYDGVWRPISQDKAVLL